jgi:Spy/CpxP family protein refolding chaperone
VRRLEQLRDNFQRLTIRSEADLRILELDIAALLDSEPVDMAKLEAKMREEEKLRTDLRIARIRAIEQGKGLLNAEQKNKLTELMRQSLTLGSPGASQNPSATERGQPSR